MRWSARVPGPGTPAEAAAAYLDLRERLRASETAREQYTAVRRVVIATGVTDMNVYSDAKSDIIAAIRADGP